MGVSLPWGGSLGEKDRWIRKVGPSQGEGGLLTVLRGRRAPRTLPFPTGWAVGGVPRTHSLSAQNSEAPQDHMGIALGKVLMRNRILYLSSFSPHHPPSHLSNLSVLRNGLT